MWSIQNVEIRDLIKKYRLKHYEIADKLEIHPSALSLKLRKELQKEEKEKILEAIEELKGVNV